MRKGVKYNVQRLCIFKIQCKKYKKRICKCLRRKEGTKEGK